MTKISFDVHMARQWEFWKKDFWVGEAPPDEPETYAPEPPKPLHLRSLSEFTEPELQEILRQTRYRGFELTGAVFPHPRNPAPIEGYRFDRYFDVDKQSSVPVIMASVTKNKLWEVFHSLLVPLGDTVDTVLETSHATNGKGHSDLYREHIDLPVLRSVLTDYEQELLEDGKAGIAVLNPDIPAEVQFDEHKLITVYADDLRPYEHIFRQCGVPLRQGMKFLTDDEHVHRSTDALYSRFLALREELGIGEGWTDEPPEEQLA